MTMTTAEPRVVAVDGGVDQIELADEAGGDGDARQGASPTSSPSPAADAGRRAPDGGDVVGQSRAADDDDREAARFIIGYTPR
jgi:hypothetical protein